MIDVNHTPSFFSDTQVDAEVKNPLIKDCLDILQLSVENRKRIMQEMKREAHQAMASGTQKRLTAKEHADRVRFDPRLVQQRLPGNGFRLIYPKEAPGDDPNLYSKIQHKADVMWRKMTGTVVK